jgi:hypothetical protein
VFPVSSVIRSPGGTPAKQTPRISEPQQEMMASLRRKILDIRKNVQQSPEQAKSPTTNAWEEELSYIHSPPKPISTPFKSNKFK